MDRENIIHLSWVHFAVSPCSGRFCTGHIGVFTAGDPLLLDSYAYSGRGIRGIPAVIYDNESDSEEANDRFAPSVRDICDSPSLRDGNNCRSDCEKEIILNG